MVGLVGGGLVAVLVAIAVVLVLQEDPAPPFLWTQDSVLASDAVEDLGGMPSDAVLQQALAVQLEGVPDQLRVGDTIVFGVTLVNTSDTDVPLDPCPTYRVAFINDGSRDGGVERPVLADMLGRFECDDSLVLHRGEHVSTQVAFTIDPAGFRFPRTTGAVAIELWPATEEMNPRSEVDGVTAFSPKALEGLVPEIGGEVDIEDPGQG